MASISVEEENYVRMSLLLTGISPCAVRILFNQEFAPECLDSTLKKEQAKLSDLQKRHIITQSQWNLMFPRFPNVLDSKTFDTTLMITLLRNFTDITCPRSGHDSLPNCTEITPAADLARIKYYRNYLAHLDYSRVESKHFNDAWKTISEAIGRLGGQHMKHECDLLRTKTLDQTNKEILKDIKRSDNEIQELKRKIEELQKVNNESTKQIQIMKNVLDNTVPWNVRDSFKNTLKQWRKIDEKMFIKTSATQTLLAWVKEEQCVTITASFGVGKTSILRHAALTMADEGYDVILVTDPCDIVKYNNPKVKTLFIVDDLCGKVSLNQNDVQRWEPVMNDIKEILGNNKTKILAACRTQVYKDSEFEFLSIFKSCVFDLLSDEMCLSRSEKQLISEKYLKGKGSEITYYFNVFKCFPLLCKLYYDNPITNEAEYFQIPLSVYELEINNLLKKKHYTKYCALALCVMFNNKLKVELLTEEVSGEIRTIFDNTFEACRLGKGLSRLVLQDELNSLQDTFIKKEKNIYKFIHDEIFDFLAYIYGQQITICLIKNAESGFIKEKILLDKQSDMNKCIPIIPPNYHQMYLHRMADDWSKGNIENVFSNINMKIPYFRQKFLVYLKTLSIDDQKRLAHLCDKHKRNPSEMPHLHTCEQFLVQNDKHEVFGKSENEIIDTVLSNCCCIGDISYVQWCCDLGVDVNMCTHYGQSPLMLACKHGHIEIVKMLFDRGVDYHKCLNDNHSPVIVACHQGHLAIFRMLLEILTRCADCNSYASQGILLLNMACDKGYTKMVKMLLDEGVDYNKHDNSYQTPISLACSRGHVKIFKMLLERGADCRKFDMNNHSLLMTACKTGVAEIVEILLDRRADFNICKVCHKSPLMMACKYGHTQIVYLLLDSGSNFIEYNKWGEPPILVAFENGHIEIVRMLLDRSKNRPLYNCSLVMEADKFGLNKCMRILTREDYKQYENLLVMQACQRGHITLLQMLLDQGVDYNFQCSLIDQWTLLNTTFSTNAEIDVSTNDRMQCNSWMKSPLMIACEMGHTEIAKLLLEKGTDCYRFDSSHQSSFMLACEHGHVEIVDMLLQNDVDFNRSDNYKETPLAKACRGGYTDIVKMLLDRGADFTKSDNNGQSPFMKACKYGHMDIVRILLGKIENYNKSDKNEQSPLMLACEHGHIQIVSILLQEGVEYKRSNKYDESPLTMACRGGHPNIVMMLFDKGVDISKCNKGLFYAVIFGHTEIVRIMLDSGADFNICDSDNQSLLFVACDNGHTEIVNILLNRGADSNKCNSWIQSPLMIACEKDYSKIVEILLRRGADYDKCDVNDRSPLLMACENGNTKIVNILVTNGANSNKCAKDQQFPVLVACERGYTEILDTLLNYNAEINIVDRFMESPLMKACSNGHQVIVHMLLIRGADYNIRDKDGRLPLKVAFDKGHTEIYKMLNEKKRYDTSI